MYVAQEPVNEYQMLTAELISELAGVEPSRPGLPTASGATFHTGRLRGGEAFFALPGANEHGIRHAEQALQKGAAFVVSDVPHPRGVVVPDPAGVLLALGRYARGRLPGAVIGISGSAGKTSTKAFVAAALDANASPGNFNTPLALATTLVRSWLSDPLRPLVMELGIDHPGEMDELVNLVRPTHGVLTAIAESHLDRLTDIAGVAREKSRLLERSPERFASVGASALLPGRPAGLIRYGLGSEADVAGRLIRSRGGEELQALGISLKLPYPGSAMAENALAALALARSLGLDLARAASGIAGARLEPGRLERKVAGTRTIIDDSYNSNPASIRRALEVLNGQPGPRCAILGDMLELGEHAERLHREVGELTRGLDSVVAVGPLARHIAQGNPDAVHVDAVEDVVALLERLPQDGTVLVKASRGMRLERVVAALQNSSSENGSRQNGSLQQGSHGNGGRP